MRHVGNDIVDLLHAHAQGKSNNTRFRKRILLPEEEKVVLADREPDAMLWAFWTGKEAAFKAVQKDQPDIAAMPRRYQITFEDTAISRDAEPAPPGGKRCLRGTVVTPRGVVQLESLITPHYVHSLATSFLLRFDTVVVWQAERMCFESSSLSDESTYVRAIAANSLSQCLPGSSPQDIEIRRARELRGLGLPVVYLRGQATDIDISLSHDGAFAAFAFAIFS